ncbi:hypothetical protein [Gimesia sp.]|uniref:hypothetical protein n=1 Tax=Gimesia sp. TaxID=2024833 RepID=UPI003A8F01B5
MAALVFVSCGQATEEERQTAAEVKEWLENEGYDVFVALETQSLSDINSGTIRHLRRSDYYLFIDFPRERIHPDDLQSSTGLQRRGSLFSHQELALAYLLEFPEAVFLKHEDVELRGIAQFQMANASTFSEYNEVLSKVEDQVKKHNWSPNYSRQLVAFKDDWTESFVTYHDHTGSMEQRVYFVHIENRRNDTAAFNAIVRLRSIEDTEGNIIDSPDLNDLKWSGQSGYSRTIRPRDRESFDALALSIDPQSKVFLHSAADVTRTPIITVPRDYTLHYQVLSDRFPLLDVKVQVHFTGDANTTTCQLIQN